MPPSLRGTTAAASAIEPAGRMRGTSHLSAATIAEIGKSLVGQYIQTPARDVSLELLVPGHSVTLEKPSGR